MVINKQSIELDEATSNDLHEVMLQQEENEVQSWADGSFKKIFWQQQKDARMKADKRGTRWHPLFIKWCLYLQYQSSKAYETQRDSGYIQLKGLAGKELMKEYKLLL